MKICNKCKQSLDKSNFSPASGGKYLRPECKKCAKKLSEERKVLREKYGRPPLDHVCPICQKTAEEIKTAGGNAFYWVIDHDHETKQFRGYICHNCNRALGNFNDNINTLLRAINYLNKNKNQDIKTKISVFLIKSLARQKLP